MTRNQKAPKSVLLTEFGDFQCPYCGEAYSIVKNLQRQLGSEIRFEFKHYPLTELHPQAMSAARAAEAARLQGKFEEMHNLLFENQEHLVLENVIQMAENLGLDIDRFLVDMKSTKVLKRVESDFKEGERLGVEGTPTFFINGEKVEGDWSLESLFRLVTTQGSGRNAKRSSQEKIKSRYR